MWTPLSSTRLRGMRGIVPDGVAHRDEAATEVQRPQGGLGQVTPDGVHDHVGAVGQGVAQRLAQVARPMVDESLRAAGAGRLELLGCGGDGGDCRAQHAAELHRGRSHPAARAQDHELLAGLQGRHRAEHVVGGPVGDAERGRPRSSTPGGMRVNDVAGTTTSSANAPTSVEPKTRSSTRTLSTPPPTSTTAPANSLPGMKGVGTDNW